MSMSAAVSSLIGIVFTIPYVHLGRDCEGVSRTRR